VMVTVSGYGRTGPRARHMAYGSTINSFTGLTAMWAAHGTQFDYTAVAHALFAVFTALSRRDRTGLGTYIDISQVEAGVAVLAPLYLGALNGVDPSVPLPNEVRGCALSAVLRSAGDDDWLAIELLDDADVTAAQDLLGAAPDLHRALTEWAASRSAAQGAQELQRAGLAASAVRRIGDVFHDAQQWARGAVARVEHPDHGTLRYPAPFVRTDGRCGRVLRSARLGEHTADVISEWSHSKQPVGREA
jgi:crotonobetainyl-CoA:carnitine CoA-transferase CaiB-like acyl-CoA transferase